MSPSIASQAICTAVLAAYAGSSAAAQCNDEWLCIDDVRHGGNVEVRAANQQDVPITFTLRVRTRKMHPDGPATVTHTLEPRQSRQVMMLSPVEDGRRSNYRLYYDWTVGSLHADHDDDTVYRLPYAVGSSFRVLQGFGSRFSHTGLEEFAVDFKMAEGTPIHAARGGVVARTEASHSIGCWQDDCGRYANYIVILHDDGTTGEYYHLQQHGVLVETGERVAAGQKIGLSGNTGHTTVPHLHFAVYRAAAWGTTQSIPVRFLSTGGIVERPRRGARYEAS
ncbi:MAG TPA: M23 family metallopeptidase [Woeseiaceae bacterium]|nr:M23 family metallopeptidase [Woeseiaceae bacterium]